MLTYPQIDPVALSIGPLAIHWYGIAYLGALIAAGWIAIQQTKRPGSLLKTSDIEDVIFLWRFRHYHRWAIGVCVVL